MNNITNAATITVIATGEQYHTLKDWGLAIGNNNYIGTPELEENYIQVPGMDGVLDMTEAVTGRPIFKSREIKVNFGGLRERQSWDSVISDMRNKIHGQKIKLTFDNDPDYYWIGRAEIVDFDRSRDLGTFTLSLPNADPYKYDINSSADDWEWDPFNFETGLIRYIGNVTVDGSITVNIPPGKMLTAPVFNVIKIETQLTVTLDEKTYDLKKGRNRFPALQVCGEEEKDLIFEGNGEVVIDYRGGSL